MINPTDNFINLVEEAGGDSIREVTRPVEPFSYNNASATITTFDANSAQFNIDVQSGFGKKTFAWFLWFSHCF